MTEDTPVATLAAAEARAALARERIHHTVAQLQTRLDPRERAQRVRQEAQVVGRTAVAIARDKPQVLGGVALAASLFLGRHRIARLFSRKRTDTPAPTAGLTPVTRTDP